MEQRHGQRAHRGLAPRPEWPRHSGDAHAEPPAGDGDGLRQSRCAAGEKDQRVPVLVRVDGLARCRRRLPGGDEIGERQHRGGTRVPDPIGVPLPRDSHIGAAGVVAQRPQLRRCQRGIHQRGRGADARRSEHRGDGQQAGVVDDGDARSGCDAVRGQARRALPYRSRQLAVTDGAVSHEQRGPGGIPAGGGVVDRPDVHSGRSAPKRGGTTRRCAATGWSTGRAGPGRRTSRCPGRGTRPGCGCGAGRAESWAG